MNVVASMSDWIRQPPGSTQSTVPSTTRATVMQTSGCGGPLEFEVETCRQLRALER
jgi:hypothetical protein